jgi:peptidoglycan/xylan/chitin deacetylase (PgdA/CDA1 family)
VLLRVVKNTPGLELERFLAQLSRALEVDWDEALERRLANELIMTWDEVRALRDAGMDVESHSRRHRVLETLDRSALEEDLAGSRADLERQLGRPVRAIAYPVGRPVAHLPHVRAALEAAGYVLGFNNVGPCTALRPGVDRLDLGRIAVDRESSDAMVLGEAAIPALGYRRGQPARPVARG